MSHSVDIPGTGQLEDRNQISFLEETGEIFAPEKARKQDVLNVKGTIASQSPSLTQSTVDGITLRFWQQK